jgi:putative DNA primase/helicase
MTRHPDDDWPGDHTLPGGSPPPPLLGPDDAGRADDDPGRLARLFLGRYQNEGDHALRLRYWNEEFFEWAEGRYLPVGSDALRCLLATDIDAEFGRLFKLQSAAFRQSKGRNDKPPTRRKAGVKTINDALSMVRAVSLVTPAEMPCWLDGNDRLPAVEMIPARNGLLHLPTFAAGRPGAFMPPTPLFFARHRVGFDIDVDAPPPAGWLRFLADLWPDEPDSVALLQEQMGYALLPDTSLHKIMLVVGPPRSGKGTIAKTIRALVGEDSVATPTLSQLAERFGLQDLLGKTVALIGDARLSDRADIQAVTERLLGISGEDLQTVDRKNRSPVTARLRVRFFVFSNEMPALGDASGAIPSRLSILRMLHSFVGRENPALFEEVIRPELPGILGWAAAGWRRLREAGRFTVPVSSASLARLAADMASPVGRFVRERCEVHPDHWAPTADLYAAWSEWCEKRGYKAGVDVQFVRSLVAFAPSLTPFRPRIAGAPVRGYQGVRLLGAWEDTEAA